MAGFIKLDRKFIEWEWYDNAITKDLFIHLLFKANFKSKQWHGIVVERGQCITSIKNLSNELQFTENQIRKALSNLKSTGEITIKSTNKYSLVTIVKYGVYQDNDHDDNKQDGWQNTNKAQASDEQNTNKAQQHKKEKKERNIISSSINARAREVYQYYEENIGALTGMAVEELDGYIELLCNEAVIYAIRQAVIYNKKSLGYVKGVCKSLLNAGVKTPLELEQYIKQREQQRNTDTKTDPYATGQASRYGGI